MHSIDLHEFASGNEDSPVGLPPPPPPRPPPPCPPPSRPPDLHCPDPHHRLHSPPLPLLRPVQVSGYGKLICKDTP